MTIHGNKLLWLFWLRWKILTRNPRRNTMQIFGMSLFAFFVLALGGAVAFGTYAAYRYLPAPANSEILFLVLTGIFLLWIVLPLLEFSANEGLDISKLALFPLTRGELMASLVISTLLDIPTIGLVLALGAVVVGWGTSLLMVPMTLLVMLVFYVQLIAVSQLVLALLQSVLHSRRFRDLSIIFVVLLSSSGYLCQIAIRSSVNASVIGSFTHATYSPYLQWLPSGMAARSIQQAASGNWGLSFAWLAALAVITFVFLYLWQRIVERGLTSAESSGRIKKGQRQHVSTRAQSVQEVTTGRTGTGIFARILPPQVSALVVKDLKYFWRDPQIKAVLLQSLVSIALLIVYLSFQLFGTGTHSVFASWLKDYIVLASPLLIMLTLYSLSYNVLGFERQSITTLMLFPIKARDILWAKNIATFAVGVTASVILILIAGGVTSNWLYVGPAFIIAIAGICTNIGLGNFTSVFFPQKMRLARRGFQTTSNMSAQGGCLRSFISMICFYVMLILLLPVAAAVIIPILLQQQWIWTISLPLSLVYGIGLYVLITALVAPRIQARVPEMIEVIGKE